MQVELEDKKSGKRRKVLAVFHEKDHWLEVRRTGTYPMTKQLAKDDVPKFLAGQQVSWSYTYFVTLVPE